MSKSEIQPLIPELAERIALHVFPHRMERAYAESLKNLLIAFAEEIRRSAVEP